MLIHVLVIAVSMVVVLRDLWTLDWSDHFEWLAAQDLQGPPGAQHRPPDGTDRTLVAPVQVAPKGPVCLIAARESEPKAEGTPVDVAGCMLSVAGPRIW